MVVTRPTLATARTSAARPRSAGWSATIRRFHAVERLTVVRTALLDGLVVQVAREDPLADTRSAQRVAPDVTLRGPGLS